MNPSELVLVISNRPSHAMAALISVSLEAGTAVASTDQSVAMATRSLNNVRNSEAPDCDKSRTELPDADFKTCATKLWPLGFYRWNRHHTINSALTSQCVCISEVIRSLRGQKMTSPFNSHGPWIVNLNVIHAIDKLQRTISLNY